MRTFETDIDECITAAGGRGVCNSNQQCVNTQGSYQCMSRIICPGGFEPDANSLKCMGKSVQENRKYIDQNTTAILQGFVYDVIN